METGSFTPSLAVPRVGAVERHFSGKKRAFLVPLSAPSSYRQHVPQARQDGGHVAGSDRRTEPDLEHARDGARFTARQPSRSEVSRRAQRCQCSPLCFDPAGPAVPTGIDSACARHVMGNCAMAYPNGFGPPVSGSVRRLDAGFPRAYLDSSRLCRSAHPPFRTQCMRSAFPIVAHRARFKRPSNIADGCYALALCVSTRAPESRAHALLATHRLDDQA